MVLAATNFKYSFILYHRQLIPRLLPEKKIWVEGKRLLYFTRRFPYLKVKKGRFIPDLPDK